MTIKIIPLPEIKATEDELHRARQEYDAVCSYNTRPPHFEAFLRSWLKGKRK